MGNVDTGRARKEKCLGVTQSATVKVSEQGGTAALKANRIIGLIRRSLVYTTI